MAKRALLGRLQDAEPDRFSRAHLRTFQRAYVPAEGVQQWRGIMANQLVYVASETTPLHCGGIPSVALTVGAPGAEFSVTFLPQ